MTVINGSGKYVHTEWLLSINIHWLSQPALKTLSANIKFFSISQYSCLQER